MKVNELIEFLKEQPQDIEVVFRCYSEQCLLEAEDIEIEKLCKARQDGWVENARPDKELQDYLVLPGN